MTQLLIAFQFLTVFPIRISGPVRDKDLAASMRYYPLVGVVLGALRAGFYALALRFYSPMTASAIAVVSVVIFSGALHLDGLADMCDGFYGHRERERVLAIMKDSRSGAMAVIGVFCLLALKIAFVANLPAGRAIPALVLAPVLGRWSMVWLCQSSTYARPEGGTGSSYIGHVNRQTLAIATLLCAAIAYGLFKIPGFFVMAIATIFTALFRKYTERRIQGMTGDTLGACSELVEVLVLAILAVHGEAM